MSQENVDVVRLNLEAWQRDDLEAFMAGIHPAMEWHAVLEHLVEGPQSVYRGHEGARRLWHTYRTDLDRLRSKRRKYAALGRPRSAPRADQVARRGKRHRERVALRHGHNGPGRLDVPLGRPVSHQDALETLRLWEQDAHADS